MSDIPDGFKLIPLSEQRVVLEGLPRTVGRVLGALGVVTWADVAALSEAVLLMQPGFGRDCLHWVKSEIAERRSPQQVTFGNTPIAPFQRRRTAHDIPAVAGVYFIRLGPYIKIGCAKNVAKRFRSIQQGIPFRTELVAILEPDEGQTPSDLERACHRRFAALRVVGEWFREDGELASGLAAMVKRCDAPPAEGVA